jgi:hypothetical protein
MVLLCCIARDVDVTRWCSRIDQSRSPNGLQPRWRQQPTAIPDVSGHLRLAYPQSSCSTWTHCAALHASGVIPRHTVIVVVRILAGEHFAQVPLTGDEQVLEALAA